MNKLTSFLIDEQQSHRKGGLYHKTQVQLAYNSNRIEGTLFFKNNFCCISTAKFIQSEQTTSINETIKIILLSDANLTGVSDACNVICTVYQ